MSHLGVTLQTSLTLQSNTFPTEPFWLSSLIFNTPSFLLPSPLTHYFNFRMLL